MGEQKAQILVEALFRQGVHTPEMVVELVAVVDLMVVAVRLVILAMAAMVVMEVAIHKLLVKLDQVVEVVVAHQHLLVVLAVLVVAVWVCMDKELVAEHLA
jgi:hypothetical protein